MALRLVLLLSILSFASVKAATNSFDLWANVMINVKKDKLLYHFMTNPRLNNDWQRFDRQFIRNGIGYQLNDNLSLMLGHDWFFINQAGSGIDYENRVWQQLQLTNDFGDLASLNRLRLEERFLKSEFITSLRWLLRLEYPVAKSETLSFVFANEVFVDLNKNLSFAEDRIFAGLNKKFTENLNLDLGYQFRLLDSSVNLLSHALFFNLVYNLDM